MSIFPRFVFLALSGFILTACNATMSTSGAVEAVPTTIEAVVAANDNTSFSNPISVLVRDINTGTVAPGDRENVTVTPDTNADGEVVYHVAAYGRTVTFESSDLSDSGASFSKTLADGTKVFMWTNDGGWDKVQEGTSKFKYMVRYSTSDIVDGVNTRGYGVFGTTTTEAQLPTSGSATYSEERGLRADAYLAHDSEQRVRLYGDVHLDVNFATSKISGEFNNIVDENDTDSGIVLKLQPATVSNGAFSTTMDLESEISGDTLTASSVNGRFYGDAAQEVGGDLSFVVSNSGVQVVGAGAFGAEKQ